MKHEHHPLPKDQTLTPREDQRSAEQIESDIRRTRGRMDATLDELSSRLSARYLITSLFDWWEAPAHGSSRTQAAALGTYRMVARQVREHPMPSLLIGAGLAWLIKEATSKKDDQDIAAEDEAVIYRTSQPAGRTPLSRSSDDLYANEDDEYGFTGVEAERPGVTERIKSGISEAKDKLGAAGHSAKQALGGAGRSLKRRFRKGKQQVENLKESGQEAAEHAGQRAREIVERSRQLGHSASEKIQHGYERGTARLEQSIEEYPLAVGLGFAALGVLVGMLIPSTRREDEWLGEKSDQLTDATREKGSELLERGKAMAQRVGEAVKQEAHQQGLSPHDVGQAFSELTDKAARLAARAKQEAAQAANDEGLTPPQLEAEANATLSDSREPRGW